MKSLLNPKFSALSSKASPFPLFSLPSQPTLSFSFRSNSRRIPNRLLRLNPPPFSSNNFTCTNQNRSLQTEPSPPSSGEIHVIVGPMFAGKTTSLLRRIQLETANGSFEVSLAEKTQLGLGRETSVCISKVGGGNCALVRNWIDPAAESLFSDAEAMHIPECKGKIIIVHMFVVGYVPNGNVAVIKSSKDTRYGLDSIVTHDGAKLPCWALANLSSFKQKFGIDAYEKLDVIGIDEAQFFDDLYEFCRQAADDDGKTVIVSGLDGNYMRRSFGSVIDIIPLADSVTKLTATCEICKRPASFTLRKTQDKQIELIGGVDVYMPVCRQHYVSGQVAVEAARHVLQSHKVECGSYT